MLCDSFKLDYNSTEIGVVEIKANVPSSESSFSLTKSKNLFGLPKFSISCPTVTKSNLSLRSKDNSNKSLDPP